MEGVSGTKYSRMDQVKFFKVCLPQISLGPFLNTLPYLLKMEELGNFIRLENIRKAEVFG